MHRNLVSNYLVFPFKIHVNQPNEECLPRSSVGQEYHAKVLKSKNNCYQQWNNKEYFLITYFEEFSKIMWFTNVIENIISTDNIKQDRAANCIKHFCLCLEILVGFLEWSRNFRGSGII